LALLAAAGTVVAIKAANAQNNSNTKAKIADNQTTIYNTKKKNTSLAKSANELQELQDKGTSRTAEEDEKMQELIESLRQENEK
jgi:hypothetical protein